VSSPASSLQHRPEAERQRIYDALVDACGEGGLGAVTLERVIERSGVGRSGFDRCFSDLDDCFAQYICDASAPLIARAREAVTAAAAWRAQLRAVLYEMVRFLSADEARAQMLVAETLAAGPQAGRVRDRLQEAMVDLVDRGRGAMDDPSTLTRVTAEAMSGALFNQMHLAQQQGALGEADELVPQLMYFLVLPYLGVEAAIEELSLSSLPEP